MTSTEAQEAPVLQTPDNSDSLITSENGSLAARALKKKAFGMRGKEGP